jgi:streptomycin 6-kinase
MSIPIQIPEKFARGIRRHYKEKGAAWIEGLPDRVAACADHWNLSLQNPLPEEIAEMSFNYIIPAVSSDGARVILKFCPDPPAMATEREGLRLCGPRGSVELLDDDDEMGVLMLERLLPGMPLSEQPDDEENTRILADVLRRFWQPAPSESGLRPLADLMGELAGLRERFDGGTGPIPESWVLETEAFYPRLLETSPEPMVLHGDLHHYNILSAEREPWLAIDPKGYIGDPASDVAALFGNYPTRSCEGKAENKLLARRVDILAEELGIPRDRILDWGWTQCVLHSWWCLQGNDDWRNCIERARILKDLK